MAAMQRKLAEKKRQKAGSSDGTAEKPKTQKDQEAQVEAAKPKQRKIVSQVDMFSKSSPSTAAENAGPR